MKQELMIGIGGLAASTAAELLVSHGLALIGLVLTAINQGAVLLDGAATTPMRDVP